MTPSLQQSLPQDLHWEIQKYLRHPTAELLAGKWDRVFQTMIVRNGWCEEPEDFQRCWTQIMARLFPTERRYPITDAKTDESWHRPKTPKVSPSLLSDWLGGKEWA